MFILEMSQTPVSDQHSVTVFIDKSFTLFALFVFFPLSQFVFFYLQVEQGATGGAGNITAEDRSVDDDVRPTAKANAKSQSPKDEDMLAKIQADVELTKSLYQKADAESVAAEKNPIVNYIQYIKAHFMQASEAEFNEFKNQTNSLISKQEYNRFMEAKEATQPSAQSATQSATQPATQQATQYQREQQLYKPPSFTHQQTEFTPIDYNLNYSRPPSAPAILTRNAPSTVTSSSMYNPGEQWQSVANVSSVWPQRQAQYMQNYMNPPILPHFQPAKQTQPAVTTSDNIASTSFGSLVSDDQDASVTTVEVCRTIAELVGTSLLSASNLDTSTNTTHSNSQNTSLDKGPEHSTPKS